MVKILIVDDYPDQSEYVTHVLKHTSTISYETIKATSLREAIAAYKENRDIELVVLDTDLAPTGEMGWQVFDALRNMGYAGPALARSGLWKRSEWTERV